ncbi:hypothetical protein LP419_10080 [Massilia sp. H-1]|nr:hypothetical protein LP419_10080 [Massilia sp. H-1]
MEHPIDARRAVWTRYWAQGATHSCGGSYGSRYEGALAQFWRAAFGALAPGARARHRHRQRRAAAAAGRFRSRGATECDAVDLAALAPAWFAQLAPACAAPACASTASRRPRRCPSALKPVRPGDEPVRARIHGSGALGAGTAARVRAGRPSAPGLSPQRCAPGATGAHGTGAHGLAGRAPGLARHGAGHDRAGGARRHCRGPRGAGR